MRLLLLGLALAGCSTSNVSAVEHERAAAAARDAREAERHRARARALREAQQRLCAGVPDAERDLGPFAHPEQIERVEPILERAFAKLPPTVPVGAIVYLRATPGLTAEWLQRIIDCHLAHHAVLGAAMEGHAACAMLAPEAPEIAVRTAPGGFAVHIRSSSLYADEILRRSRALTTSP